MILCGTALSIHSVVFFFLRVMYARNAVFRQSAVLSLDLYCPTALHFLHSAPSQVVRVQRVELCISRRTRTINWIQLGCYHDVALEADMVVLFHVRLAGGMCVRPLELFHCVAARFYHEADTKECAYLQFT